MKYLYLLFNIILICTACKTKKNIIKTSKDSNVLIIINQLFKETGTLPYIIDTLNDANDGYFFDEIKENLQIDFLSSMKASYYASICNKTKKNNAKDCCYVYIHKYENEMEANYYKNKMDSIHNINITRMNTSLFDALHYSEVKFISYNSLLIYYSTSDTICTEFGEKQINQ